MKTKGIGVTNIERSRATTTMAGANVEYMENGISEVPMISYRNSKGKVKGPKAKQNRDGRRTMGFPVSKVR